MQAEVFDAPTSLRRDTCLVTLSQLEPPPDQVRQCQGHRADEPAATGELNDADRRPALRHPQGVHGSAGIVPAFQSALCRAQKTKASACIIRYAPRHERRPPRSCRVRVPRSAERSRPVRASHFAGATDSGIVGSQTALRARLGDDTCDKQRHSQASKSGPKQLTPSVPYTAAISPRNKLSS